MLTRADPLYSICFAIKFNDKLDLLAGISVVLRPFVDINSLPNDVLVQILLYGDKDLSNEINKNILKLTLDFIHKTGRFD